MHANNAWRVRSPLVVACWLATLLLLGTVQPTHPQTTGDQPKQISDEEMGKRMVAADSYTVDAVNRHDSYAVAAVFWEDGVEVTPYGILSGRPAIEHGLAEQYKTSDVRDFTETWDEVHVTGDHAWYVAHWSANNMTPSGERRPVKGSIAGFLEKRSGEWKVRLHASFPTLPPVAQ